MNPIGQCDMKIYTGNLLDHFGDLAKPNVSAIAHVCNCMGVMGSGVALAVRTRYPEAFAAYKKAEKDFFFGLKLGTISVAKIRNDKRIYNLHAQGSFGNDGQRYLDYEALYKSLDLVCDDMNFEGLKTLGIPYKMGSDRAGGNWNIVLTMAYEIFTPFNIEVIAIKL